jgi:hydrogenase maturation protease
MPAKLIFVGNPLAGDDGIGPHLYTLLKDSAELADHEMLELGTAGLDLISYVKEDESLIIIDALHSNESPGKVSLLEEKDLNHHVHLASLHDLGVEQTIKLMRVQYPKLKPVHIIGVNVKEVRPGLHGLSEELSGKMPAIVKEIMRLIREVT